MLSSSSLIDLKLLVETKIEIECLCCVSIGFRYHKLDDFEIIGMDYIWKIVLKSNPNIANKAVELLKDCFEKREKFARGLQVS